jgi:peroxiredoxin
LYLNVETRSSKPHAEFTRSICYHSICKLYDINCVLKGDFMVATPSTMLQLGTAAPEFTLPDVDSGQSISIEDYAAKKALLVMFLCQHCPYVKHVEHELAALGRDYQEADIGLVAISSNDVNAYPEDDPDGMRSQAQRVGFTFPYLFDETQEVAKAYTAACTPDFFLFDEERQLVYRGQMDGSRPGSEIPVTGEDLRAAIDAVLAGDSVNPEQRPSLGCNIKWLDGNEPDYFG